MIALDTETTGLDFRHGAKPFFLTWCGEDGQPYFKEWDVDPLTRDPIIPQCDLDFIGDLIWGPAGDSTEELVLHNAKFDITALSTILPAFTWPWDRTHDTITADHVLASNRPHNLTDAVIRWLNVDIEPYEKELEEACKKARRMCQAKSSKFHHWMIAKEGMGCMPSVKAGGGDKKKADGKDKLWKCDMWLPRAIATVEGYAEDHPWWTVLSDYACADSVATLALWKTQRKELEKRKLWDIYSAKVKVLPVAHKMESRGITIVEMNFEQLFSEYTEDSRIESNVCTNIARNYNVDLELPANGVNGSLRSFMLDTLKLEPVRNTKAKSEAASLDKNAMSFYLATLPPNSQSLSFVKSLLNKRKKDTALSYMRGYRRFMICNEDCPVIHPSLNPNGTDHLRWSCSNPNEQNISKQEGICQKCEGKKPEVRTCLLCSGTGIESRSLRFAFGPGPDREWWSMDAKNIERRIPVFEAKQQEIIDLFERPDDPPYYGSEHLMVAHILHPKLFEECRDEKGELDGRIFKKLYASTLYQWVKNGNFAIQYGAQLAMAERTYRVPGSYSLIKSRFKELDALNQQCIRQAEKYGYVTTIPDKHVDSSTGYPILCSRSEYGKIIPTVPLNYHTSGTAMWWMNQAMIRTQAMIDGWQAAGFDGYLIMQVHDELVFDFPKSKVHPSKDRSTKAYNESKSWMSSGSNLWRVRQLQAAMELGGEGIGIPTPVSAEYHENNWSEGMTF